MRTVRAELTTGMVVVPPDDAPFLWTSGFFGVSPQKDSRTTPLYGTLSLSETCYLLNKCAEGHLQFEFSLSQQGTTCTLEQLHRLIKSDYGETAYRQMLIYSDLRARGWIVQGGLNYGTDFLLYRTSPETEHAPYAVVVRPDPCPEFVWREAIALNRVAATAKKQLVVAFVSHDGMIRYLHISRWIPEAERRNPGPRGAKCK
ncbi:tRNA intron endonuclease [Paramicrosporidium saccamoebae]|uniref:tRNA-intron lyase n=1 Tax=Paramicrosporidium saccamoebae TaxID=1246581 RepID=A0A2H9THQ3_9FUNG|nr:tRNA intron endonuclease [Paramicrosporidium saccamoebae]